MTSSALPDGSPARVLGAWRLWLLPSSQEGNSRLVPWQEAFRALFEKSVESVESQWPLPGGVTAHVLLGGASENQAWNVDEDALGFQALCSHVFAEEGDVLNVAADHRCYVNVPSHATAVEGKGSLSIEAALATLPSEMARLALFAQHSCGRTPREVFDEDGGEIGLTSLLARIEEASWAEGETPSTPSEEAVEKLASEIVAPFVIGLGDSVERLRAPPSTLPARKGWFRR